MGMNKNAQKVLNKLFDNDYCTEKEIQGMNIKEMLCIRGITVTELNEITALQDAIKTGKVISYLGRDNRMGDSEYE